MGIEPIELKRLWDEGCKLKAIAAQFGVSEGAVSMAAKRAGLAPRPRGRRSSEDILPGDEIPDRAEGKDDLAEVKCRRAPASVRFDRQQDREIFATGGKYRRIERLARRYGVASGIVLARWHVLRSA